jgi:hypothetical protein
MNESSPYQAPLTQGPTSIPVMMIGTPATVTVLAIFHLVFAGIGILSAAWGLMGPYMMNWFSEVAGPSPEMEAQVAMQKELLVAVPMIMAGILMLRKRKNGLKWSNIYAWSSIGAKVITMVLAVTIMTPMMEGLMDRSGGSPAPPGLAEGFMVFGVIIGAVFSCTYPVLSLILLNRQSIKEWFARLPQ